jgi:hypothetical protein
VKLPLSLPPFSLSFYLAPLLDETNNEPAGQCTFIQHPEGFPGADLSSIVDQAPMQMRKEMPLETVTSAFQKMVCAYPFGDLDNSHIFLELAICFVHQQRSLGGDVDETRCCGRITDDTL